ncbi:MAG: glycosyltransferase [Bacteroidetes bacterium]|nr:glycosyltransferase [Bacteroidota bacterium]
MKKILLSTILIATMAFNNSSTACELCGKESKVQQLHTAMQKLWADHMTWTYATVDAFFNNPSALQSSLDRLLQNQKDIGNAIVPVYGQAAGDKLTELLTAHIKGAVPVLTAAKNNDKSALDKAVTDWYANAKEIANFLTSANPKNWPATETEPMMKEHIDLTISYAVSLLKKDYTNAIKTYDKARESMSEMGTVLASGVVKQFPDKFKEAKKK